MFGDDSFSALYLEFVLYARRNPAARAKLIENMRRERAITESLIAREHGLVSGAPPHAVRALAEFARAVFSGLTMTVSSTPKPSRTRRSTSPSRCSTSRWPERFAADPKAD